MIRALALVLLVCAACDDTGADADQPRVDDLEAGLRAINRAVGLSTAFLGQGVVDPNSDANTIALALYQQFKSQTGTCATGMPMNNTVTASLAGGCTLSTAGFVAGGTVTVTVNPSPSPLDIHFDYQLTADGQPVTGTLDATQGAGSTFNYHATAKTTATLAMPAFTVGIAAGGVQISGTGTLTGKKSSMLTVNAIHQAFNGCYPDEGSVRVEDSGVDFTVTFANDSPRTGHATISEGGADRTVTLPARTGCPH